MVTRSEYFDVSHFLFDLLNRFKELGTSNQSLGAGRVDGVKERLTNQVGIDERWHQTDFGAAQPDANKFDPIFHEQGHALTRLVSGA